MLSQIADDIRKEGIKEGIKKGIEEGEKKGKLEDAAAMLDEGLSVELISKITKLTKEEIEKLK